MSIAAPRPASAGLARLATSTLVYAISAAADATAAGLFASAANLRAAGSPLNGPVGIWGQLALDAGLLSGLSSLILLILALRELVPLRHSAPPQLRRVLSISWTLFVLGFVALIFTASVFLAAWVASTPERFQLFSILFQLGSAVAAGAFVFALACVPLLRSSKGPRLMAAAAGFIAFIGIAGETALGFANSTLYGPTNSSLLTFGGWPLLNLNLPFGALVALSAALLWLAYRKLPSQVEWAPVPQAITLAGPGPM